MFFVLKIFTYFFLFIKVYFSLFAKQKKILYWWNYFCHEEDLMLSKYYVGEVLFLNLKGNRVRYPFWAGGFLLWGNVWVKNYKYIKGPMFRGSFYVKCENFCDLRLIKLVRILHTIIYVSFVMW